MDINIEKSAENFDITAKYVKQGKARHTGNKFHFLPKWLLKQSEFYLSEIQTKRRKGKVFKRGALIFVDFGVNIGAELSNRHWAVVLNKTDNPHNQKLTVVPVSSKNKGYSVEIDGVISDEPQVIISKLSLELQEKLFFATHYAITELTMTEEDFEVDYYEYLKKLYLENYTLEKGEKIYKKELAEIGITSLKIEALINHYERFQKTSYAKCDSIQTISKDRIIYINDIDPCGKFKVSDDTLNRLDNQLRNLFTNTLDK